jgi:hypothetical protein
MHAVTQNDNPAVRALLLQEQLFELLRQASWVHQNPHEYPAGTRWTGAIMACHAVAGFIYDAGASLELAVTLLEMKEGFKDLERGTVPPIFSLKPEPLKRDRSTHRKFNHMWAAAILEIAMKGGEGEEEAATRIARSVNEWPAFGTQVITETTIINWRKAIKGGSMKERAPFTAICEGLRSEPDGGKAEIERALAEGPRGMQKS